jgi:hypothetical protein
MHTHPNNRQSTMNNEPTSYTCRHIYTIGRRCGSPCLRGEEFCYYHHTNRPRPPMAGSDQFFAGPDTFEIASFEDHPAIQLTLLEIARRIANNTIDLKRATKLIDACNSASLNLTREARASIARVPSPAPRSRTNQQRTTKNEERQHLPSPQPIEIVQDVTFSPTLGPLAPVLEHGLPEPEEEQEPSLASRIYSWLDSPPPPEPVPLEKRPYDFDTLQLLRRTLATTTNPETADRIRKALEEEALLPGHNLHIQACIDDSGSPMSGSPDVGLLPPPSPKPGRPMPHTPRLIPEKQKAFDRRPPQGPPDFPTSFLRLAIKRTLHCTRQIHRRELTASQAHSSRIELHRPEQRASAPRERTPPSHSPNGSLPL